MNYYVIRHKASGLIMPQLKKNIGYSFWLANNNLMMNALPVPRLLPSEKQAKKVVVEWAKGIFEWRQEVKPNINNNPLFNPLFHKEVRRIRDLGRKQDDLEVVQVVLQGV